MNTSRFVAHRLSLSRGKETTRRRSLPADAEPTFFPVIRPIIHAVAAAGALLGSNGGWASTPETLPTDRDAQETPEQRRLETVQVQGRHYDNGIGSSDAASQGIIRAELLKSRPALRPGEVLEFVPGLMVTQHSGDGKANQYFLRGFNLDHGTDFATSIQGMPVNIPSHAHGQGYADLNVLIPELVDHIDYRKGPYFAANGDFAAAGSADIHYQRRLDAPWVSLTAGEGGYRRGLVAGSHELSAGMQWVGAAELMRNDGPWQVPEGLNRRNLVMSLSRHAGPDQWTVSVMDYHAHWRSTDQIPERLIEAGTYEGRPFGRFDAVDPSDRGSTRRTSLSASWVRDGEGRQSRLSAYAIDYQLALFSNFTYALERPEQGDQSSQQDHRKVYGLSGSQSVEHLLGAWPARTEVGFQMRQDRARVGLFETEQGEIRGRDPGGPHPRDDAGALWAVQRRMGALGTDGGGPSGRSGAVSRGSPHRRGELGQRATDVGVAQAVPGAGSVEADRVVPQCRTRVPQQ